MSEEALHRAEKRTKVKGKGERERHTQLKTEFQRISRRKKKVFLSEQVKETEKNNRMGKAKDLFKKIGDTRGVSYAKMNSIKDKNGKDLTETEEIKKRWQEYNRTIQKIV